MNRLSHLHPAWIGGAIGLAVVLWLASGQIWSGQTQAEPQASTADEGPGPTEVLVRDSVAAPITRETVVSGRTAPVRSVTVRAQTGGRVAEVAAPRGAAVDKDAVIARLAPDDRSAQLRQAKAMREQRRLQYKAAQRMQAQGYQTDVDLAEAKANWESAQAEVARIEQDIDHTVIRAPFAGLLETRPVEEGDVVATGDEIGTIIDQDPFIVAGSVSEDVIGALETGQPGTAKLVDGSVRSGNLRYIASQAEQATRTFRVELEIPNPEGRLIAGASAEMRLPLEEVAAHQVEPAILTLNEAGEFGIKTVDDAGRVQFHAADIVRNRGGQVWLAGLPERVRIITVGQGFVTAGDAVATDTEAAAVADAVAPRQGEAKGGVAPESGS